MSNHLVILERYSDLYSSKYEKILMLDDSNVGVNKENMKYRRPFVKLIV